MALGPYLPKLLHNLNVGERSRHALHVAIVLPLDDLKSSNEKACAKFSAENLFESDKQMLTGGFRRDFRRRLDDGPHAVAEGVEELCETLEPKCRFNQKPNKVHLVALTQV
jgi:hypothetical protein